MEDRSGQVLGVAILFLTLAWVSVILRIYVRAFLIKAFGKDDVAMLVTLSLFTAYMACQLGGVAHGTGKRRELITDTNAQIALRYWFFCEVFYTLATSALKVALGFFLLRIALNPIHIWIIRIIMVSSVVLGSAYCCIVLFQCKPVSYWWDLNPNHHGTCLSPSLMTDTTYVVSALNSIADWVFGVVPIFIVKDLQMKKSVKVIVATILSFGAIGSAATIIRMPYIWTAKEYKGEFLWRTTDIAIWTTVEVGVGITAGCIATLKPLMKHFLAVFGVHGTTSANSAMPWSSKRTPHSGKKGYYVHDTPLDSLRPMGDKNVTTTTVIGRGSCPTGKSLASWADRTRRDSEEDIFPELPPGADFSDMKGWKGGISKSVEFTTTEERAASNSRSGESSSMSEDGHEIHRHDDVDRLFPRNPAVIHERL